MNTITTSAHPAEMTDQERELHIQHCGYLMEQAMLAGNRQEALDWLQAETQALGQRSAAQVARMTAEIDRAIDEGSDYFAVMGARHGAAARKEANK